MATIATYASTPTEHRKSANWHAVRMLNLVESCWHWAVENLSAGADITARAMHQCRVQTDILAVKVLHQANSTGVDGSNTVVLTLRNITQSADIATVTLSTNVTANTATALTLTAAQARCAAGDILGLVVTQGATADLGAFTLQTDYRTFSRIASESGTVLAV